jgi:hypothetical protein
MSWKIWLFVSVYFVMFFYLLGDLIKPIIRELEAIRKILELQLPATREDVHRSTNRLIEKGSRKAAETAVHQISELRRELELRHNEATRAAYFQKHGVYPDHWQTHPQTPNGVSDDSTSVRPVPQR